MNFSKHIKLLLAVAIASLMICGCGGSGSGSSSESSGTTLEAQMTTMTNWEVHQTVDQ